MLQCAYSNHLIDNMPQKIRVDKKLAAHILLDPELQGRLDVQGHFFETTFGYIHQYLETYSKKNEGIYPPQLQKLNQALHAMVKFEKAIRMIDDPTPLTDTEKKDEFLVALSKIPTKNSMGKYELVEETLLKKINMLKTGEYLLLPGGWSNSSSPGHAMIYQFTKTDKGIKFSIYNSGAGIENHEKTMSTTSVRYYPIRSHHIENPYNIQELKAFIQRLISPQTQTLPRTQKTFNGDILYQDIDKSLIYLDAKPLLESENIPESLTTAGQLTGTCAQRVIHQMFKIHFSNLKDYQDFIFHFKWHALREFTAQPIESMDQASIEIALLAIKQLTKLLKQLPESEDQETKKAYLRELSKLQKRLVDHHIPDTKITPTRPRENLAVPLRIELQFPEQTQKKDSESQDKNIPYIPIKTLDTTKEILPQLDALIRTCRHHQNNSPDYVIEQLEAIVLSLPFPSNFNREQMQDFHDFDSITSSEENIKQMLGHLEALQHLYNQYTEERPERRIVHGLLIGLHDYFLFQLPPKEEKPSHAQSLYLSKIFLSYHHCADIGSHNPLFDQKFAALMRLYQGQFTIDSTDEKQILQYYRSLITEEEQQLLLAIYNEHYQEKIKPELDMHLRKNDGVALHSLFCFFQENGEIDHATLEAIDPALNVHIKNQHEINAILHYKGDDQATNEKIDARVLVLRQSLVDLSLKSQLLHGIIEKFSKQLETEKFIHQGLGPYRRTHGEYICPHFTKDFITFNGKQKPKLNHSFINIYHNIIRTYGMQEGVERKILDEYGPEQPPALLKKIAQLENKWCTNRIQLSATQGFTSPKKPLYIRDLFHLRTSTTHQVQLTLDYFKQFISTLDDQNTQKYVEANLFEGNLLNTLLDNNQEEFLAQFDGFIIRGLQFFLNDQALLTQPSLFFIHLQFFVNQYLAYKNPDCAYLRLTENFNNLSQMLRLPQTEAIKASLHQYQFLTAMKLHSLRPGPLPEFFSEAFLAFFKLQSSTNPDIILDAHTQTQIKRSQYHFQAWLEKIPTKLLQETIKKTIHLMGIDVEDPILEGEFPIIQLIDTKTNQRYKIDVKAGRIFKDNRALGMTPTHIKQDKFIQQLGLGNVDTCFISPDAQIVEWITPKQQVRVTCKRNNTTYPEVHFIVEKKWAVPGVEAEWYERCHFTSPLIKHKLPNVFDKEDITLWVNPRDKSVIIAEKNHPIYRSIQGGPLEQLDEQGHPNGFVLSEYKGPFQPELAEFSHHDFIIANHNEGQWHIEIPLYHIALEITKDKLQLLGTDYVLTDKPSPFPSGVACLNLSNKQDQITLVAVQPFYVAKEKPGIGHYYALEHARQRSNEWHDALTEKVIAYKTIEEKLAIDKPYEALYLCYIYLCNHQLEDAWSILENITSLEGNYQELIFLQWIINKLPHTLEPKEKISNPRYLACQLKALSLFTDKLADDIKPIFPDRATETIHQKEIREFYTSLPQSLGDLLTTFQKMERHLSHPFFLQNAERRSLLNTYQRLILVDLKTITINNTFKLKGPLGYQYLRLNLETLLKQKKHLESIQATLQAKGKSLKKKFVERLREINKTLQREACIMKLQSRVELVEIPIQSSDKLNIGHQRLSIEGNLPPNIISTLSSTLSEPEFISNLSAYLHIAFNHRSTTPEFTALTKFCTHHILECSHPASNLKKSTFEALTTIIYRLLTAPSQVKMAIQQSLEAKNKERSLYNAGYTLFSLNDDLDRNKVNSGDLRVYQVLDIFEEILADNTSVFDSLCSTMRESQKIGFQLINAPHSNNMDAFRNHLSQALSGFASFKSAYVQSEVDYQLAFNEQLKQLETASPSEAISQIKREQLTEQNAGRLKFQLAQQQKAAAEYFSSDEVLTSLKTLSNSALSDFNKTEAEAWQNALNLANHPPHHPTASYQRELEKVAGLRHSTLTKKELLKLYFNADATAYIEMTGLTFEQISTLHQLTHQAITQSIETQHLQRLIKKLDETTPDRSSNIATILMSENAPEAQNDPTIMVFQHQENILLREKQCLALKNLLSETTDEFQFNESVEKVIMGGGKSKVILPLLVQKKANGHSLAMVEVPRPLLKTNHADLNKTSQQLFSQKAHCFEFSRDSNCSPERLEEIYNHFVESMTKKDYWVTTGDSIQSLELKYLELLLSGMPEEHADIWKKQVHWMEKITTLIREFGDVVIDEMHQGLLLKKELNYSIGAPESVDLVVREQSIKLYRFIDQLSRQHLPENTNALLRNESMRIAWDKSLATLTEAILTHELSPLRSIIDTLKNQFGEAIKEDLRAYLNNEKKSKFIDEAEPAIKDILAFYKEQISNLLPHTLIQKHAVIYGPADEKRTAHITDRVIAVPYIANSQPSDRSDFGNLLTKVNYTIQSLLIEGLNESLLKEMIEIWLKQAGFELETDPSLEVIKNTPIAIGVNHCLKGTGFQLESINIKDDQQIKSLLEKTRFNHDFIFKMLEQHILEKITIEPDLLRSNAINHINLYHTAQGLSGTPYNYTTYHQRIQFNRNTALGTDGYLLEIIKHKKTKHHAIEFTHLDAFLSTVFSTLQCQKPQAIIDVGAMFTGIKNHTVALALANHWQEKNKALQYILYFNQDDVLCALNIHNKKIITLTSSDPDTINQKLGCSPEERFTYYDQAHTVGADLKQPSDSTGVVLIDPKTPIQSFLQGAMRMRGLEGNQTLEIITPPSLAAYSIESLSDLMTQTEQQQLSEENFHAAIAKLENIVRNDCIQRLHALPPENYAEKVEYANAFRDYFVQSTKGQLFDKYGKIATQVDAKKWLSAYQNELLEGWFSRLKQLNHAIENSCKEELETAMTRVVSEALPFCPKEIIAHEKAFDQETETQILKQNQKLLEQKKELHNENMTESSFHPKSYLPWSVDILMKFINQVTPLAKPLNEYLKNEGASYFSNNFFISGNQALTYYSQTKLLEQHIKPVFEILFSKQDDTIKACLITPEEARQIEQLLQDPQLKSLPIWLSTTQHTRLSGNKPNDLSSDSQYHALIEQARYFNGEFSLLNQQKKPFQWFNQSSFQKIQFFRQHLSPYRQSQSSELELLEAKVSKISVGFKRLRDARFDPLTLLWENLLPDATKSNITALKNLSKAFDEVNRHPFETPNLDLDVLIKKYTLPLEAIGELLDHLNIYKERQWLWKRFKTKPNFKKMSTDQLDTYIEIMKILQGKAPPTTQLYPTYATYFFQQLDAIELSEWRSIIQGAHCQLLLRLIPNERLLELLQPFIHNETEENLGNLLKNMTLNKAILLMKHQNVTTKLKKLIITQFLDPHHRVQLLDAIPEHQFDEVLPTLTLNVSSFTLPELKTIAQKSKSLALKLRILTGKKAMLELLMRRVLDSRSTNQNSTNTHIVSSFYDALNIPTQCTPLNPIFLLSFLQSICEFNHTTKQSLWETKNNVEFKSWLSEYDAMDLYASKLPPLKPQQIRQLKETSHFDVIHLLSQWQNENITLQDPITSLEPSSEEGHQWVDFDNYLLKIRMLQQQFPLYKKELNQLVTHLTQAKKGPPEAFDSVCRQTISEAKKSLEYETGLWGLLKPILNGILKLLKRANLYHGTLFTSEATKAWEEKQLDHFKKNNGA